MNEINIHYYAEDSLRNVLRQIFSQYTMWTRFLLVSKYSKIQDQEVVENRLYKVAQDLSSVLLIYYDKPSVDMIESSFRKQISLVIQLINTLLLSNTEDITFLLKQLDLANQELSTAFHTINPYINETMLYMAFQNLILMTVDEILKRKNNQYSLDVYQYDFIEYQILMIADLIWEAFIKQFYS